MKRMKVQIIVDLMVGNDFDVGSQLAVVKYEDIGDGQQFLSNTDDFEVLDYIEIKEVNNE